MSASEQKPTPLALKHRSPRRVESCSLRPGGVTPTGRENRKRRGSSMPLMSDGARSPADRAGTGDLHALRGRLTGGLVLRGDPEWDDARRAWNLAVDQRPVAIALVESVEDVVKVVDVRVEHGHGAAALAVLDGTILVKTSRLRGVEIDAGAARARIQAGALWEDVVVPAA